jgi:hypothetical protein
MKYFPLLKETKKVQSLTDIIIDFYLIRNQNRDEIKHLISKTFISLNIESF